MPPCANGRADDIFEPPYVEIDGGDVTIDHDVMPSSRPEDLL